MIGSQPCRFMRSARCDHHRSPGFPLACTCGSRADQGDVTSAPTDPFAYNQPILPPRGTSTFTQNDGDLRSAMAAIFSTSLSFCVGPTLNISLHSPLHISCRKQCVDLFRPTQVPCQLFSILFCWSFETLFPKAKAAQKNSLLWNWSYLSCYILTGRSYLGLVITDPPTIVLPHGNAFTCFKTLS